MLKPGAWTSIWVFLVGSKNANTLCWQKVQEPELRWNTSMCNIDIPNSHPITALNVCHTWPNRRAQYSPHMTQSSCSMPTPPDPIMCSVPTPHDPIMCSMPTPTWPNHRAQHPPHIAQLLHSMPAHIIQPPSWLSAPHNPITVLIAQPHNPIIALNACLHNLITALYSCPHNILFFPKLFLTWQVERIQTSVLEASWTLFETKQ